MSDCPNVEIREALPELLHGRLDAAAAARVREHVALCADCAAELELLGRARRVYQSSGQPVDTAAILRALPAAPVVRVKQRPRAYSLGMLQLAAAIVLLLVGAFVVRTVTKAGSKSGENPQQMVVQPLDSVTDTASVSPELRSRAAMAREPRILAMALSDLDDLEADEIETMLDALDRIDAAPAAEPDTLIVSVPGVGSP
jgi:hypothetical protein